MADHIFYPNPEFSNQALIRSLDQYRDLYENSMSDPDTFWSTVADRITWYKKWSNVREFDFVEGKIKWFDGAKLNVSYNCLDRHVEAGHGDQTAIIWEGNNPEEDQTFTYGELLAEVQKFANVLKSIGVEKGDRVCLYMQMIPQLPVAMLACARIGAVHSVVFGAFSPDSLRDRINDSACKVVITQDTGVRGTKQNIPMKTNADKAVAETPSIEHVIVVQRTSEPVAMVNERDFWWHEAMATAESECKPEEMDAEDPLFILYTSGSTGKPKGVLHTSGGYLVYTSFTHEKIFDYHPGDVYWCTADIGWITGHSYIVYGPLANRAVTIMFEGVPNYPDYGRFWDVVDKHRVKQFYTAPTALRALMKEGDEPVTSRDLSSLRLLGTVGEPIKEPEWMWYHNIVGKGKCPIVDTWWQTETGGIMITPLPGATPTKPGSATSPFFGIHPVLLTEDGQEIEGNDVQGLLAIKESWPGQMRTL
ncbi:MAG: acetate--CoA ligase, partial [Candidatus Neomarinimicrobiota bacterium]